MFMKKVSLFFLIWVLISTLGLFNLSPSLKVAPFYQNPQSQSTRNRIIIYVNNTIFANLSAELNQYKIDLETDGYNVSYIQWTDPTLGPLDRANNLRLNLTLEYNATNILGAVFVGELPFALLKDMTLVYPCDLFFMDLDGLWQDLNSDQILDAHFNGTGDMYPEIFIGRINPYMLSNINATQLLKDYFQRNHLYRMNMLPRYNNSLMYIDDDWEPWSDEWKADLDILYSNNTLLNNSIIETNADNYLREINKTYDFAHVFIHSDSVQHYFKVGGVFKPEQVVNYSQICTLDDKVLFYNLYCCYAAKFDNPDNIASHYLFNSNYSLAVFGSARTGGFLLNQYLYSPLNQSKTLGEAFHDWWFNDQYDPVLNHGPNDLNMTGNVLLGDPFLRIKAVPISNSQNPSTNSSTTTESSSSTSTTETISISSTSSTTASTSGTSSNSTSTTNSSNNSTTTSNVASFWDLLSANSLFIAIGVSATVLGGVLMVKSRRR
jgi:hypothetical protein